MANTLMRQTQGRLNEIGTNRGPVSDGYYVSNDVTVVTGIFLKDKMSVEMHIFLNFIILGEGLCPPRTPPSGCHQFAKR